MKYFILNNEGKFQESNNDENTFKNYFKAYYFDSCKLSDDISKKIRYKTNENVEDIIVKILEDGIKEKLDVKRILAWKLGNIKMEETGEALKEDGDASFIYNFDWEADSKEYIEDEVQRPRYTRTKIKLKKICEFIIDEKKKLKHVDVNSENYKYKIVEEFFRDINIKKKEEEDIFKGIGVVYALTLLYFITEGRIPIYDKFVHIALKALYFGEKPLEGYVFYGAPSGTSENNVISLMQEYLWLIGNTVGIEKLVRENNGQDNIKQIRQMDRALWVYGHLFRC